MQHVVIADATCDHKGDMLTPKHLEFIPFIIKMSASIFVNKSAEVDHIPEQRNWI